MKFSRDSVRTGGVGDRETTDLDRRSADSVQMHWRVKEVDYSSDPPRYRVERGDENDEHDYNLTDWLPAAGARAQGDVETHFLEVGERVTLLSEGGDLETAQVVPAGTYTKDFARQPGTRKPGVWVKKFANGQEVSVDRETGQINIIAAGETPQGQAIDGKVKIAAAKGSIVMDGGTTTIKMGDNTLALSDQRLAVNIGGFKFTVDDDAIRIKTKDNEVKWRLSKEGLKQVGGALVYNHQIVMATGDDPDELQDVT